MRSPNRSGMTTTLRACERPVMMRGSRSVSVTRMMSPTCSASRRSVVELRIGALRRVEVALRPLPQVHQLAVVEPADAEGLPVDEAVRQLLDAPERVADVDVRRDDLLHREDLVQLLSRDRLLEDPLEQQPGESEHDPHDGPADRLEARDGEEHDRDADRARAERDDLVAKDQRLLLVHELVADEEREVEKQPADDEVREDEQRERRQRLGGESRSARGHRHRGPGVGAVRRDERERPRVRR